MAQHDREGQSMQCNLVHQSVIWYEDEDEDEDEHL
jgi:hypothetical protein